MRELAAALGTDQNRARMLMHRAGITPPLERTLTPVAIDRFIGEARRDAAPPAREHRQERAAAQKSRKFTPEELGRIRQALNTQRTLIELGSAQYPLMDGLIARVARAGRWPRGEARRALGRVGITEPLEQTLTPVRIDSFINAIAAGPSHATTSGDASGPTAPARTPKRPSGPRPTANPIRGATGARVNGGAPPVARPLHIPGLPPPRPAGPRSTRPVASQMPHPGSTHPACRRLAEGFTGASPAHATADLYLALAELTTYRSTSQAAAVAEVAADRFGIHADTVTAGRLHGRAAAVWRDGLAAAQLDHLDRLQRRVRGVFYDGHRDRVTAWDSSSGAVDLYTCTGAQLRSAARAALDYGDLTLPAMRHQVVDDHYQPAADDDPALILAVAAEQLGRQAAVIVRQTDHRPGPEPAEEPARGGTGPAPEDAARTVSAATWVQPVSGHWGELVVGHLDASYARHTPGPRSRAATVVREHKRRAPGTSKTDEPTITVRSHPRRGTGPETPSPKVTKVSGRPRLWR